MRPVCSVGSGARGTARSWHRALGVVLLAVSALVVEDPARAGGPHYGAGTLTVHERGVDLNHDGVYDLLWIDAEAQLDEAGTYLIRPRLCADTCMSEEEPLWGYFMEDLADWQLERWPNVRPRRTKPRQSSDEVTTDARKRIRFSCWFDGDELAALQHDGPWHFCPSLEDVRGMASAGVRLEDLPDCAFYDLSADLRPWSRNKFGQWPVLLRNVTWRIVQPDAVALDLALDVQRSGRRDFRVGAVRGVYAADSTISRNFRVGADTLAVTLVLRDTLGTVSDSLTATGLRLAVHLPAQRGVTTRPVWTHPAPWSPWSNWCGTK